MRSRYKLKEEEERSGRERNCVYSTRKRDKHKHTHTDVHFMLVKKRVEALYESTQLSQQEFYIYFELQKVFK